MRLAPPPSLRSETRQVVWLIGSTSSASLIVAPRYVIVVLPRLGISFPSSVPEPGSGRQGLDKPLSPAGPAGIR
ncbi:hypothetical protein GCM10009819_36470 [Agromyces tropicus]|uniref:Uncharacterized protein n=1 Tax=Agromyces tropicus TaxID=555371 RepID=A0ABN2UYN2_9MICO